MPDAQTLRLLLRILSVTQLVFAGLYLARMTLACKGISRYRRYAGGKLAEGELSDDERRHFPEVTERDVRDGERTILHCRDLGLRLTVTAALAFFTQLLI